MTTTDTTFENWAKGEIVRLRAEADGLEHTLQKYSGAHKTGAAAGAKGNGHAGSTKGKSEKPTQTNYVIELVRAAGESGMSRDDLFVAMHNKFPTTKDRLRVLLWNLVQRERVDQRKDGRIYARGG